MVAKDFPTGSCPPKNCLANSLLTIAVCGLASVGRRSLPSARGIFIVPIHCDETLRKFAKTLVGGAPLMETNSLSLFPLNSGQLAKATASTPGPDLQLPTISSHR